MEGWPEWGFCWQTSHMAFKHYFFRPQWKTFRWRLSRAMWSCSLGGSALTHSPWTLGGLIIRDEIILFSFVTKYVLFFPLFVSFSLSIDGCWPTEYMIPCILVTSSSHLITIIKSEDIEPSVVTTFPIKITISDIPCVLFRPLESPSLAVFQN